MSPNWLSKTCILHCLSPNPERSICTWPEGISSDVESLAGVLLQFPTFLVLVFVVSANGNTPTNNHSALKARKVPVTADMYETESLVFFQACTHHICAHTHTHTFPHTHTPPHIMLWYPQLWNAEVWRRIATTLPQGLRLRQSGRLGSDNSCWSTVPPGPPAHWPLHSTLWWRPLVAENNTSPADDDGNEWVDQVKTTVHGLIRSK